MRLVRNLLAVVLMVSSIAGLQQTAAQTTTTTTSNSDAEIQKEALEARALYENQNYMAALPLYEDLYQQQPKNTVFLEGLAMCQLAKAGMLPPADAAAMRESASRLLLQAKALGDNSNLLQIVLERLSSPVKADDAPKTPARQAFDGAEKAFSSGDLQGAVALYRKANELDPKMYEAPLFAGDAEYKLKHYDEAGTWYAKAIAINPNRETAYRFWGDVLTHKGDQKQAQSKFEDAVIAEPYTKTPWIGLQQWADANHAHIFSPDIKLPAQPAPDAKGNLNVSINAADPNGSVWLIYMMMPTVWRDKEFKKHYPNETVYRHSLAEQAEGLRTALEVVKNQKTPDSKLDPTLKALIALDKDGMLECWILLNHADQGIAQDYAAYRAQHRELLHAYLDKYVVHI